MEQKTARDHIKEAFGIISSLSVSGDAVDAVAAARFALKQAYDMLSQAAGENEERDGRKQEEPAEETA